tara:strand:- start:8503 stop:9507 length:1005 start_codon:yes stop_codon:yes gene_type:complete
MVNIVLVGAGKLGSRHLQALSQLKIKGVKLFVIDPSLEARSVAESRFHEMPSSSAIASVTYLESIGNLKIRDIELAVVATTSEHRQSVITNLCASFDVKNMILEKFLFQSEKSYTDVAKILQKKEVKTWVNLPRRQWSFYQDLKIKLSGQKIFQVDVVGTKWSVATSAIHFIDLISFLTDDISYEIVNLDFGDSYVPAYSVITGPRESKYVEFFGSMHGRFSGGVYFNFTCLESEMPLSVILTTSEGTITIYEELGQCFFNVSDGVDIVTSELAVIAPYQSELTNKVAEDIITNGECSLTPYEESARLHLPLLTSYLEYLAKIDPKFSDLCPIT